MLTHPQIRWSLIGQKLPSHLLTITGLKLRFWNEFSQSFQASPNTAPTPVWLQVWFFYPRSSPLSHHRKLFLATPSWAKIYSSAVLPKLDCFGTVWDSHQYTLINQLETNQKFTGKVVCKNCKASYSSLLNNANGNLCQQEDCKKLCHNIIWATYQSFHLPHSPFTLHPSPLTLP